MIKNKYILLSSLLFLGLIDHISGQDLGIYSKQEVKDLSQKVEDQMKFLEFFLNTVGSKDTPTRDKDVVIMESYKKIFRDGKVQVEDDLLLDRKVITNKDVTAYLKDIEFFFKDAGFKLKVREVKPFLRDNGELSFMVSMDRTITATGLNNEKVSNTKPRFVEVNVDKQSNELKIASMYTTKLSRDEELAEWWSTLSYEWESYFRNKLGYEDDSLTTDQLYKISVIDSINLSGNKLIHTLAPIEALRDLKYVDISNTNIEELNPISNVTFLTFLNIANTPTQDIQFIKYSDRLLFLDISGTQVEDISELGNLKLLKTLKAVKTPIQSFGVLNSFESLRSLNLSASGFNNIENIQELRELTALDISNNYLINFELLAGMESLEEINLQETNIVDLSFLGNLKNLKRVNINMTEVTDLSNLDAKPSLQRVYADRTRISEQNANEFARKNRKVLLIHHVENLQTWWDELPEAWKEVLNTRYPNLKGLIPSTENLALMVGVDSLDLSESQIKSLGPVLKFTKINFLIFDNTAVQDLTPLSDIKTLTSISGKKTQVKSLQPLVNLTELERIDFAGSPVEAIANLINLKKLKYLNVDGSTFDKSEVPVFLVQNPDINIIYRTDELEEWWDLLEGTWKKIIKDQFGKDQEPNSETLHNWTANPEVDIERVSISNLRPLKAFVNLRRLSVSDVPIIDISDISELVLLEELKINQAPMSDLAPISSLVNLTSLDLSNTGIEDLRSLSGLQELEKLNVSATNVKILRGLEALYTLKQLDIASTNVRTLRHIQTLSNLEKLVCYNTRLSKRAVDSFRRTNPECDIRYY